MKFSAMWLETLTLEVVLGLLSVIIDLSHMCMNNEHITYLYLTIHMYAIIVISDYTHVCYNFQTKTKQGEVKTEALDRWQLSSQ